MQSNLSPKFIKTSALQERPFTAAFSIDLIKLWFTKGSLLIAQTSFDSSLRLIKKIKAQLKFLMKLIMFFSSEHNTHSMYQWLNNVHCYDVFSDSSVRTNKNHIPNHFFKTFVQLSNNLLN